MDTVDACTVQNDVKGARPRRRGTGTRLEHEHLGMQMHATCATTRDEATRAHDV